MYSESKTCGTFEEAESWIVYYENIYDVFNSSIIKIDNTSWLVTISYRSFN